MNLAFFTYEYSQAILLQEHFQSRVVDSVIALFGTSASFIFKFFGGILLLFLVSAIISHILKIDRFYDESHNN